MSALLRMCNRGWAREVPRQALLRCGARPRTRRAWQAERWLAAVRQVQLRAKDRLSSEALGFGWAPDDPWALAMVHG